MINNIIERIPGNQPILITEEQALGLRSEFERNVIDPIFFGHDPETTTEGDIKRIQGAIDDLSATFDHAFADCFEVSIIEEKLSNQ